MKRLISVLVALVALAIAAPAHAITPPDIGVGEQSPRIFDDPNWRDLNIKDVRIVASWDAAFTRWERNQIRDYYVAAKASGARILVAFGRSRVPKRNRMLPSPRQYRKAFRRFRRDFPYVKSYVIWNEANHCSQPVCHRPDMAAAYYNVARSACGRCTLVAADVLDTPNMVPWIRVFNRYAKSGPKIYGLHNYLDANRFRTIGTRALLRVTRGQIWFTETGGLVKRSNKSPIRFPDSVAHAAKATKWVFNQLIPLSLRIRRVYFYHWSYAGPNATWDSALINPHGKPRQAYKVLKKWLERLRA